MGVIILNDRHTTEDKTYNVLKEYFSSVGIISFFGCDPEGMSGLMVRMKVEGSMHIGKLVDEAERLAQEHGWEIEAPIPYNAHNGTNMQRITLIPRTR